MAAEPKVEVVEDAEVKIEEVNVEDDGTKNEEPVAVTEESAEAGAPKQSKSEKKIRKQLQKLGLQQITGITRATIKKSKAVTFVINTPDVYKSPSSDTYIIFGEAKVDDFGQHANFEKAVQSLENNEDVPALEEQTKVETVGEAAPAAESGEVSEKDIELVLAQVESATREQAIEALKKNNGDIVNAIMELS